MRTIVLIAALVLLPFFVRLFLALMVAAGRVWRGGRDEAREFSRVDLTVGRFWFARVDKQDYSSLVPTRAGLSVTASAAGFEIEETRTISKDVF